MLPRRPSRYSWREVLLDSVFVVLAGGLSLVLGPLGGMFVLSAIGGVIGIAAEIDALLIRRRRRGGALEATERAPEHLSTTEGRDPARGSVVVEVIPGVEEDDLEIRVRISRQLLESV